jgi:preprotein translocase subunit YajC
MMVWEILAQIALVAFVLLLGFTLLVRPQLRRSVQHKQFLASLVIGDRIVTRGGLIGEIVGFEAFDVISLKLSNAMVVSIERRGIERKARA